MRAAVPESRVGAGRFVLLGAGLWLIAILAARLLLNGGDVGLAVFVVGIPVLLLVLRLLTSWGVAFALLAFFTLAVLSLRVVLVDPRTSWPYLLLAPLAIAGAAVAYKVVRGLFVLRKA